MSEFVTEKRQPGETVKIAKAEYFRVMTESTQLIESRRYIHRCGAELEAAITVRSIWYEEMGPCTGGGETRPETIPFCPDCEIEPSPIGSPIISKLSQSLS